MTVSVCFLGFFYHEFALTTHCRKQMQVHYNLQNTNFKSKEFDTSSTISVQIFKYLLSLLHPYFFSWILSHRFSVESPVVILGDKSGSMDIAIRTSSIIAGILAVVTSAKLIFFDDKCMDAPYVPISVQEVINLAMEVKAGGGTCPAAALLPFYDRKEVVKTFVIVTDEEEAESESSTNLK